MLDKFQAIFDRYKNLEEQLSDPEAVQDLARFKKINKEYKDLVLEILVQLVHKVQLVVVQLL
jgi:protein subunit release factor A